jgi:hypothetical protein
VRIRSAGVCRTAGERTEKGLGRRECGERRRRVPGDPVAGSCLVAERRRRVAGDSGRPPGARSTGPFSGGAWSAGVWRQGGALVGGSVEAVRGLGRAEAMGAAMRKEETGGIWHHPEE